MSKKIELWILGLISSLIVLGILLTGCSDEPSPPRKEYPVKLNLPISAFLSKWWSGTPKVPKTSGSTQLKSADNPACWRFEPSATSATGFTHEFKSFLYRAQNPLINQIYFPTTNTKQGRNTITHISEGYFISALNTTSDWLDQKDNWIIEGEAEFLYNLNKDGLTENKPLANSIVFMITYIDQVKTNQNNQVTSFKLGYGVNLKFRSKTDYNKNKKDTFEKVKEELLEANNDVMSGLIGQMSSHSYTPVPGGDTKKARCPNF